MHLAVSATKGWPAAAPAGYARMVGGTLGVNVSQALQAYAALATSADRGAVRDLSQLKQKAKH